MTLEQSDRLPQLDVLRGFAVLGIYWIGVAAFGLPYGANALPTLLGSASNFDLGLWASTEIFAEGAMRGLFSMLFGASALLFLDDSRLNTSGIELVERFYRRNLLLILFGLIHAYLLLWPHDVLYAYGLLGLFIFPLRKMPALMLFIFGFLLQAFAHVELDWPAVVSFLENLLSDGDSAAMGRALLESAGGSVDGERFQSWLRMQMDQDMNIYRSGYWDIFLAQTSEVAGQQSVMMYKSHVFEIGGMMLIGMALYRWGVLSGQRSTRFYLLLALAGLVVGGWMRGEDVFHAFAHGFDPRILSKVEEIDYDLGRLPVALGHIGLIGLLCKWHWASRLTHWLAATGRLALTNYIGQTIFSITLFYGFGFGLFGSMNRWELAILCVGVWVFQMIFSVLWLTRFRFGPLEWVWRSLTIGQWQPLRLAR